MQIAIRSVKRKIHTIIFLLPVHPEDLTEWHTKAAKYPETWRKRRGDTFPWYLPGKSIAGAFRGLKGYLLEVPRVCQLIGSIGGGERRAEFYWGERRERRKCGRLLGLPISKNGVLQPVHAPGSEGR
jgi:hypothetical protein